MKISIYAWHKKEQKLCKIKVLTSEGAFLIGTKPGEDQIYDGGVTIKAPTDGRFCEKHEFQLLNENGKPVKIEFIDP